MSTILDNWLWDAVSTNWLIFVLTCALILGFWFGLITFTGDWFGHAPATAMLGVRNRNRGRRRGHQAVVVKEVG